MEVSGKRTDIADEEENLKSMDTLCEPCEGDNVKSSACGFCKECEEYMCNTCFGQHLRLKLCKHHTLIDMNVHSETCLRSNAGATKCKQHQIETVKYYCREHEAVGCGDCLVSEHSGCKTTFIKDLSDNFQHNGDYKTCMNKLENLISERKEFEKKIQENKMNNKVMLEKALQDIKQFRLDINKYLDNVESDITCKVKNVMEENDILLTKLENDCTMISSKLEDIRHMLNSELYQDNVLFINTVECKPKLSENEKAISDMKSKSMKKYEFLCDQQLSSLVTTSQKLGTLAISTSAVLPQTTGQANEKEGRSLVALGARVSQNHPDWSDWYGNGTVTDVHGNGKVEVEWDKAGYTVHREEWDKAEYTVHREEWDKAGYTVHREEWDKAEYTVHREEWDKAGYTVQMVESQCRGIVETTPFTE